MELLFKFESLAAYFVACFPATEIFEGEGGWVEARSMRKRKDGASFSVCCSGDGSPQCSCCMQWKMGRILCNIQKY